MLAIECKGLTKVYKTIGKGRGKSLDSLDLQIQDGEVFGFLGRNGAGKTTCIKLICSLLRPTSGEAFLYGDAARSRVARGHFGYLPEQPYFYEYLTPRETIDFYGRMQQLSGAERARTWDHLSEVLDLRDIASERIKGFSKGMRQRIGFAVALVGDPRLLILDEPMSGLDPIGRRNIRELILRLRDEGKTLFFSSHVLGDVEQVCDRVGILVQGQLKQQGRIDDLLQGQVNKVELSVAGLSKELLAQLKNDAVHHRHLEGVDLFQFADLDAGNRALAAAQSNGAVVHQFTPIKSHLEDYFMAIQDATS